MPRCLWSILLILLALAVIPACEQPAEMDNSEEVQRADIKLDNGEIDGDNAINNQKYMKGKMIFFEEGGLSFTYPDYVGGEVTLKTVTASDEDAFIAYPEHKKISFSEYLLVDTMISPIIQIFPLDEYLAINGYNAEIIEQTKLILARQSYPDNIIEVPFVPQPMAAQIFYANFYFIESRAGSGLRYITQYGQDIGPVTNDYLFYTYQGITADGRYYISATFPVYHPELPIDLEDYFIVTGTDYETFEDDYIKQLEKSVQLLDLAEEDDYIPSLQVLDNIMAGLAFE